MKISDIVASQGGAGPQALLDGLLEHRHAAILDGECVDTADDYEPVVEALLGLAGITLPPGALRIEEGSVRTIRIEEGGQWLGAALEGGTDWIDAGPLLELLDQVLRARGLELRFWPVWSSELFGQGFAVLLARDKEVEALRSRGLPVGYPGPGVRDPNLQPDGTLDGHPAVAYAEGAFRTSPQLEGFARRLAALTGGVLSLRSVALDYTQERMLLALPDRTLDLSTDDPDEGASLAEAPDLGVIAALNRALAELGDPRRFSPIFGYHAGHWIIVCLTPDQYVPLQDKYN